MLGRPASLLIDGPAGPRALLMNGTRQEIDRGTGRLNILAFREMGAQVTLAGPPTLIPRGVEALGVEVRTTLDDLREGIALVDALPELDLADLQRDGLGFLHERKRLLGLLGRDEVQQPALVLLAPAAPIGEFALPFVDLFDGDAVLGRLRRRVGRERSRGGLRRLRAVPLVDLAVEREILVVHDAKDHFTAVNIKCSHRGCDLNYEKSAQKFVCPCHGSEFDLAGAALKGPATKPLTNYHAELKGDEVMVTVYGPNDTPPANATPPPDTTHRIAMPADSSGGFPADSTK